MRGTTTSAPSHNDLLRTIWLFCHASDHRLHSDDECAIDGGVVHGGIAQNLVKVLEGLFGEDDLHAGRCLSNSRSTCSRVAVLPSPAALSPRSIPASSAGGGTYLPEFSSASISNAHPAESA